MKKKLLIYGLSAVVGLLAAALISGLAFDVGVLYSFFFGFFGAGVAVLIARTTYHIVIKDYTPEMFQISIYIALACAGWLGAVLATTWGWVSLWLSVMSIGILMAIGSRFIKSMAVSKKDSPLEKSLRYRFINDTFGGTPDLDKPLTLVVNGTALTIEEADKAGFKKEAEEGRAYIAKFKEGR